MFFTDGFTISAVVDATLLLGSKGLASRVESSNIILALVSFLFSRSNRRERRELLLWYSGGMMMRR